jgi:hypothetical protein
MILNGNFSAIYTNYASNIHCYILYSAKPKGMRLGYMGHLTFISDEVIKLFEGYPEGIIAAVKDTIDLDKWHQYCIGQLKETKERDSLPLGEIRLNGMHAIVNDDDDDDDDEEEEEDDEEEANAEDAALRSQVGRFDHLNIAAEHENDEEDEDREEQWIT